MNSCLINNSIPTDSYVKYDPVYHTVYQDGDYFYAISEDYGLIKDCLLLERTKDEFILDIEKAEMNDSLFNSGGRRIIKRNVRAYDSLVENGESGSLTAKVCFDKQGIALGAKLINSETTLVLTNEDIKIVLVGILGYTISPKIDGECMACGKLNLRLDISAIHILDH